MSNNKDFEIKKSVLVKYTGCSSDVIIPDEVLVIGQCAFCDNHSIIKVELHNFVTCIESSAFEYCEKLQEINIPNSVTSIGNGAFMSCKSLKAITIPNSISKLERCLFMRCESLTSVSLPETITDINPYVFEHCGKLTSINIPASAKIGFCAFNDCGSLDFDALGLNHTVKIKGRNFVRFCDIGMGGCYNIPDKITTISKIAFMNCSSIEKVTLPQSVTSIGENAFESCIGLNKVTLNEGLEIIEKNAFNVCELLEEVVLPKSLTKIGEFSFRNCKNLKRVILLNDKTQLESNSFDDCLNLEEVSLEVLKTLNLTIQVKVLGHTFDKNGEFSKEELTYIKRKSTLKSALFVEDYPEIIIYLIDNKTKLSLDELDTYIEVSIEKKRTIITAILLEYKNKNYSNNKIEEIKERKDLLDIGLAIPSTFTELKQYWNCSKKDGVVRISGYKGSLNQATIPFCLDDGTKIVRVGTSSSADYEPLEILTIEAEITVLEKGAFAYCDTLREITLPDTLVSIESNAFYHCENLQSITLPPNLEKIKITAFEACKSLKEIVIPSSVDEISNSAFALCKKLSNVILPDDIDEIKQYTFANCESLKEITIPASVTKIGHYAFWGCFSLTKVNFLGEVPKLGRNAFAYCPVESEII